MDTNNMTAEDILASLGADAGTGSNGHTAEDRAHPVNALADAMKGKPEKLKTPKAEKPAKPEKVAKVKAEKPAKAEKDPNAKRVRVTKHEQAMYDNVARLSIALNRQVTVTRSDEVRYMRALFSLSVGDVVLASSLTVNEIEMLVAFQEKVAALATDEVETADEMEDLAEAA